MLDFAEVGRRITMRQIGAPMPHTEVVAPLIGQLLDPEYTGSSGTALLTTTECANLGGTLQRQAELLDQREHEMMHMNEHVEAMQGYITTWTRRVWWIAGGTVVCALWLSAVLVAVLIR